MNLEQYLLQRELLHPYKDLSAEILDSPEKLQKVAGVWVGSGKEGIKLAVEARIMHLRDEIALRALPVEVPVLRQAIAELTTLLDDFENFYQENTRRITNNNT